MAQNKKFNFIVIDDSRLDCFIAEKVIRNTGMCESVLSFVDANIALQHICTPPAGDITTVILVDIQMPVMNGFQFVEAFEELQSDVKARYVIFIYSSSINDDDLSRVHNYTSVRQFLNKPLNSNMLGAVLPQ